MATINNKYARLNKDAINKLQELEKEIGKIVIAYDPESPYAELKEGQLKRIEQLEQELGVVLIAYKP